jgi:hypothetical protein
LEAAVKKRIRHHSSRFIIGAGVVSGIMCASIFAAETVAQQRASGDRQVTYTKHVAPILQKSCITCHRPEQSAPMSLTSYEEVRPWARSIKTRVANREMPPWHIDRNVGIQKFKDDPSLSESEIATIVNWVDAGAPRGNMADMPPPRVFPDGSEWAFGKPDLIVKFPTYTVPATGPDLFPTLVAPLGLTEDRYIKAIQTRPATTASRRVVHHTTAAMVAGDDGGGSSDVEDGGAFIVEYASGKAPELYPEDSGVLLKAGHKLNLSTHLHSVGEEVKAEIEIGFKLHPSGHVPKYIRYSTHHGDPRPDADESLDIPAGQVTRTDGYTLHAKPAKLIAFQPHMHTRGAYQCIELIYPSNPSKVMKREMINCAHWNYNWHLVYNYADDVAPLVPAGTIVHIISWHDNSANNRSNPDPKNWVGYGQRTIDDMGFAWVGWVDLTEAEYEQEMAARKAKRQLPPLPAPANSQR